MLEALSKPSALDRRVSTYKRIPNLADKKKIKVYARLTVRQGKSPVTLELPEFASLLLTMISVDYSSTPRMAANFCLTLFIGLFKEDLSDFYGDGKPANHEDIIEFVPVREIDLNTLKGRSEGGTIEYAGNQIPARYGLTSPEQDLYSFLGVIMYIVAHRGLGTNMRAQVQARCVQGHNLTSSGVEWKDGSLLKWLHDNPDGSFVRALGEGWKNHQEALRRWHEFVYGQFDAPIGQAGVRMRTYVVMCTYLKMTLAPIVRKFLQVYPWVMMLDPRLASDAKSFEDMWVVCEETEGWFVKFIDDQQPGPFNFTKLSALVPVVVAFCIKEGLLGSGFHYPAPDTKLMSAFEAEVKRRRERLGVSRKHKKEDPGSDGSYVIPQFEE